MAIKWPSKEVGRGKFLIITPQETQTVVQGSHGLEKPGKSREFVVVFFPGLEVWNFVEKPGIFA